MKEAEEYSRHRYIFIGSNSSSKRKDSIRLEFLLEIHAPRTSEYENVFFHSFLLGASVCSIASIVVSTTQNIKNRVVLKFDILFQTFNRKKSIL